MTSGNGKGRYLLVVDDEEVIRRTLRRYFEHHGYEVAEAPDISEARESLRSRPPDGVFLDKNLPGGSGVEFISEVRATRSDVVVLVITGYASAQSAARAQELGADAYLAKPFRLEDAKVALESALARRAG
ncbi:MAG TPA: response regulator [Polyangia bacterium]|nr:response regulator [Polyangia bacterium]